MMRLFFPMLGFLVLLGGCQGQPEQAAVEPEGEHQAQAAAGVHQMTPSPLPIAPVGGTESLQGGGSAAGQIMKDRARNVGGGSSLDQMGGD